MTKKTKAEEVTARWEASLPPAQRRSIPAGEVRPSRADRQAVVSMTMDQLDDQLDGSSAARKAALQRAKDHRDLENLSRRSRKRLPPVPAGLVELRVDKPNALRLIGRSGLGVPAALDNALAIAVDRLLVRLQRIAKSQHATSDERAAIGACYETLFGRRPHDVWIECVLDELRTAFSAAVGLKRGDSRDRDTLKRLAHAKLKGESQQEHQARQGESLRTDIVSSLTARFPGIDLPEHVSASALRWLAGRYSAGRGGRGRLSERAIETLLRDPVALARATKKSK